jgi:hypothetical protein
MTPANTFAMVACFVPAALAKSLHQLAFVA